MLRTGGWVAWIDARRTLAPAPFTALGDRLVMVRPRDGRRSAWCADLLLRSGVFALVVIDGAPPLSRVHGVRLAQLARERDAACVVLQHEARPSRVSGAVRLRLEPLATRRRGAETRGFAVVVEKGGPSRNVRSIEVSSDIVMARRVCTDSEIPDRRGVARGTRRPWAAVGGSTDDAVGHPITWGGLGVSAHDDIHTPATARPTPIATQLALALHEQASNNSTRSPRASGTGNANGSIAGSTDTPATGRAIGDGGAPPNRHSESPVGANALGNGSVRRSDRAGKAHATARRDSAATRDTARRTPAPPPHWDALPRALADDTRLRVVSLAAGRAGVRAGMTLTAAQARCAALEIRTWDDHAIADAVLAATTAFLAASPQVTPVQGAPGMWWIGATGFNALGGEDALARTLLSIAQRWHPDARVAIADSCVAARAATWAPQARTRAVRERDPLARPDGITLIPGGQCAAYLAPAPLGLVPMDDDLREALQALGLRTIGALASLAPGDIERRWGAEGLTAWRLAHGDDPRRPGLVRVEATRSTSVELPAAVESTAPVLFVLRAQLDRLVRELVEDGRSAAAVSITLILDAGRQWPLEDVGSDGRDHEAFPDTSSDAPMDATRRDPHAACTAQETVTASSLLGVPQRSITREVRPARPLARLEPLFDQCRALLERWVIPAPIIGITVGIPATAPLAADQGDLLIPSWRDAAMNAEAVFARLRAALDPDNTGDIVVRAVTGDAHKPEAMGQWVAADAIAQASAPVPAAPRDGDDRETADVAPAVLRLLDAPEVVDVEAPHGVPAAVWWRGRRLSIAHADGPERLSGDWWRADAFARDYWRCDAEGEGELLVYGESAANTITAPMRWFVQGWYD